MSNCKLFSATEKPISFRAFSHIATEEVMQLIHAGADSRMHSGWSVLLAPAVSPLSLTSQFIKGTMSIRGTELRQCETMCLMA